MSQTTVTLNCVPGYKIDTGGFHVMASVAGGTQHDFQIDTGSSGMAIGVASAGNYQDYTCYGPGQFHYEPSGNVLTGNWYLLPVTLYSASTAGGTTTYNVAAVSQCMVLVVETSTDGKGNTTTFVGGMMGVSAKSENINYNVLLNAYAPGTNGNAPSPLAPAYVLNGGDDNLTFTIGQTHTSGDGFNVVNLQPVSAPPLPTPVGTVSTPFPSPLATTWAMPMVIGTFTQNTTVINITAALELDTGIDYMLVAVPEGTFPSSFIGPTIQGKPSLTDKVNVTITASGTGPLTLASQPLVLNYKFTTGSGAGDPAPTSVLLMPPPANNLGDMVRINTGIRPLAGHNYMYDALNGVIGMQAAST